MRRAASRAAGVGMVHEPARTPDEAAAFFDEHGYVVAEGVVPDEVLDDALFGVERFYHGERDHALPVSGGFLDWRPEHGDGLRINDYVSLQNRELRALVTLPVIGRLAARLAGAAIVRLFHDQLIGKPAGDGSDATVVGWHVDRAYWPTCTSDRMLTAWVPLVDCLPDMGPLCVIDGSHRWDGSEWMATFHERDLKGLERRLEADGRMLRPVELALRRGQVSFHHGRTIHGSRANTSGRPRLALTIHMQDGDNRYREVLDASGRPRLHVNHLLCRRDADDRPDYTDPTICPVLWPATEGAAWT